MKLDKEKLDWLTKRTNRSNSQTQELFELCDCDFEKLKALEVQLRNCFCYFCPGDREEVNSVMKLTPKSDRFKLE